MDIRRLLLVGFFLSGMAVLIYEVAWTRPLQLIFGSTIYAVSTMLTAFLAGFALGAYLFRNIADNSENPVKLFAILELSIGLYGLIMINLFALLPSVYLSFSTPLQFVLCFAVLIIPATLMGGVWPVINKAYAGLDRLGKDVGTLYSFNSFGSALGPILAGFLLIPLLGITKTSLFAASLNLLVAISIFAYLKVKK